MLTLYVRIMLFEQAKVGWLPRQKKIEKKRMITYGVSAELFMAQVANQ